MAAPQQKTYNFCLHLRASVSPQNTRKIESQIILINKKLSGYSVWGKAKYTRPIPEIFSASMPFLHGSDATLPKAARTRGAQTRYQFVYHIKTTDCLGGLAKHCHLSECRDAITQWWMGAKETGENLSPGQWRHNVKRSGRLRYIRHRDPLIISAKFFEGADQPVGVAHQSCSRRVSGVFALTGDSELHEHGSHGR